MNKWSIRDLDSDEIHRVIFPDGGLFTIIKDRSKRTPTYALGDDLAWIEGRPKSRGPMSDELLLAVLNSEGAKPISASEAANIRARHRAKIKNTIVAKS
jgi:hypothetical protein